MKSKAFWTDVWADVIANTTSGILMAFLALITIDQFYATPQVGGKWEFELRVKDTSPMFFHMTQGTALLA